MRSARDLEVSGPNDVARMRGLFLTASSQMFLPKMALGMPSSWRTHGMPTCSRTIAG